MNIMSRFKALEEVARAACKWRVENEIIGKSRRELRGRQRTKADATLREVIRRNWDLLH